MNSAEGPEWKLWEQPDTHRSRGRVAFQAALAARQQGDAAFDRFHLGLLRAKHEDGQDHGKKKVLLAVAEAAGLDTERFERDLADRSSLAEIGRDYTEAREVHGVFGTPTVVFPTGESAYLKMRPPAPTDEAVAIFTEFTKTVLTRPYISEIKRPIRPESPSTA